MDSGFVHADCIFSLCSFVIMLLEYTHIVARIGKRLKVILSSVVLCQAFNYLTL